MADVEDYSTTAASNTDDFPENQAPSTVNDGGRETQADIAQWHQRITGTVTAGGTADALTVTFSPAHTALAERMIAVKIASDNTSTTPTLNLDTLGAKTIVKNGNEALVAGDLQAGAIAIFWYSTANTNWELLNPATAYTPSGTVTDAQLSTSATATGATWVGARTALLSAGDVGSYMFAKSTTDKTFGDSIAGSALTPSGAVATYSDPSQTDDSFTMPAAAAQSGTWQCMGRIDASFTVGGAGTGTGVTLWLRIS